MRSPPGGAALNHAEVGGSEQRELEPTNQLAALCRGTPSCYPTEGHRERASTHHRSSTTAIPRLRDFRPTKIGVQQDGRHRTTVKTSGRRPRRGLDRRAARRSTRLAHDQGPKWSIEPIPAPSAGVGWMKRRRPCRRGLRRCAPSVGFAPSDRASRGIRCVSRGRQSCRRSCLADSAT